MQEVISCPSCRRKLQTPQALLGQDVQCPTCGATFVARLPGQSASAPPRYEPRDDYPPDEPQRPDGGHDPRERYYRESGQPAPHRAGAVLTLGILSLVAIVLTLGLLSVILGPIGWVMGQNDLTEMRTGRMDREGEGNTNAGRVCAMIGTLVGAVVLAFICMFFALAIMEESRHPW
jgi:hypothetical protein